MESNRSSSRLKQRLARVFRSSPSLLRSSCNPSTSTATNLSSTASSRALLHDVVVAEPAFVPRKQSHLDEDLDDAFFRSLSFAPPNNDNHRRRPIDLTGCRPTLASHSRQLPSVMAKNKNWKDSKTRKKERRVRESGGYYETGIGEGRTCPPASPSSPSKSSPYYNYCFNNGALKGESNEKIANRKIKKKLSSNAYGFTSSSSMGISDDELGFFSSEDEEEDKSKEEETETFFSSRSFSSDYSSEFYQHPKKKKNKNMIKKKKKKKKVCDKWGVCKEYKPLVSVTSSSSAEKKKEREATKEEEDEEMINRGFAVKKRSSDPYGDFRSSMVEMIIERQIFGAEDLENLLECYLSLNSPRHHPIILQAFSDIWVVLFDH